MGIIIEKKAGIDKLPALFLDQALTKVMSEGDVAGCAGIAACIDPGKDFRITHFPDLPTAEQVNSLITQFKDNEVVLWIDGVLPHTDDVQPFTLFSDEAEVPQEMVAFVCGPYSHYKEADDARTEQYHFAQKKLFTMIEPIWDKHDGDIHKVMAELDNPFVGEAIKGFATGDSSVLLIGSSGRILKYGRDLKRGEFAFGWTSDPVGYFEGSQKDQGGKPASFGLAPRTAGDPPPRKKMEAAGVYNVNDLPPKDLDTKHVTAAKKDDPPPRKKAPSDTVIGDTRKSEPIVPKTDTAIGTSVKPDLVRISPPRAGEDATQTYRFRFYTIYLGKMSAIKWNDFMDDGAGKDKDYWKTGPAIVVNRAKVIKEHQHLITELKAGEKPTAMPPTEPVKTAPMSTPPDDKPVKMPDAPVVSADAIREVEELITSPKFKVITDRGGEQLKSPDAWAKAQARHALFSDVMGLSSVYDTVAYGYDGYLDIGKKRPEMLSQLTLEWMLEAHNLKRQLKMPAPAAKKDEPVVAKPAATTPAAPKKADDLGLPPRRKAS